MPRHTTASPKRSTVGGLVGGRGARATRRGFRIALDDLGEGAGGLPSLTALEPDIAKLDVSLVRRAPRSSLSRAILGSLINVCRRAGITTVAVGAETADEVDLRTDLGVDLVQGFYFAHPGPAFPPVPGG